MKKTFDWQEWIDRNGIVLLEELPAGWKFISGATHFPLGWSWACNGRSPFDSAMQTCAYQDWTGTGATLCKEPHARR